MRKNLIYPQIPVQSDTFHAIAHRLGLWCNRLEKQALSKIADEYEAVRLLENAKSKKNRSKRRKAYKLAIEQTKVAIDLYDNFIFVYQELLACLRLFDAKAYVSLISRLEKRKYLNSLYDHRTSR